MFSNAKYFIYYRMTFGLKKNYINATTIYAWDELPQPSTGGEACLTTIFGILLVSQTSILNSIKTMMQAS
jgi:hypothetical protein